MRSIKRQTIVFSSLKKAARSGYAIACGFVLLMLGACTSVVSPYATDYDETDLWDSTVVYLRHVDVFQLADANGAGLPGLSGLITAVAARGERIFTSACNPPWNRRSVWSSRSTWT